MSPLPESLRPYEYTWPLEPLDDWQPISADLVARPLAETRESLAQDSRWPSFFPSPICLVTTTDGRSTILEKVVGASIVNRFPYTIGLSFCRDALSPRHYARGSFMRILEQSGSAVVQFLPPGPDLDAAMRAIAEVPDDESYRRIAASGLTVRPGVTNRAPVFTSAYMAYECQFVRPGRDFSGDAIHPEPWVDVGSHRLYFLEINAIQLREDVAHGTKQVRWRALPAWEPSDDAGFRGTTGSLSAAKYQKGYTPEYSFPSAGTVAFAADAHEHGMAIKHLPPLPADQVEVDNDRARWPCFFPSSAGMITTWSDGIPNLMPCGSTTIVSRFPLVVAPCVSYAAINARYAPRATLEIVRKAGRFACGVPYIGDAMIAAMRYSGNVSLADDPEKIANSGLDVVRDPNAPLLPALPLHFDCEVQQEVRLGTHVMFLGEVKRLVARRDVTPQNPLRWVPWAAIE